MGAHEHPTMVKEDEITGNGLILYFKAENIEEIRENLRKMTYEVEQEIRVSPNSRRKEFSMRDPDGYYITIAEFHRYVG